MLSATKTKKGYMRYGSQEMQHRRVWRKHFGPVPVGYFIHHIDGDKQNNSIENLKLVTAMEHKRIHSGCRMINGVWWKRCKTCGKEKQIDKDFYTYYHIPGRGISMSCKKCTIRIAVQNKKNRRLSKLATEVKPLAAERVIDAYEKAAKEKTSPVSTRAPVENGV